MRLLVTVLALGTGCSTVFGLQSPVERTDSGFVDAALDASVEVGPDVCTSFSAYVDTCGRTYGAALDVSFASLTFNTDTKTFSGFSAPQVSTLDVMGPSGPITFILVESVELTSLSSVRMVGSRAGGVLSNSTITVEGTLDVGNGGAAARAACGSTAGAALTTGAGGGGGGSFWGAGGDGSDGDDGVATGGVGAPAQARPASPVGGCAGSAGGAGTNGAGAGGLAGGAVILVARTSITISGTIDANGQGGRGGPVNDGGGGGGGAGGMIVLEAPAVTVTGVLAANGGAGGEGAGGNAGIDGADGPNSALRAVGGAGGAGAGADGGLGGGGTTLDGSAPGGNGTGGGGGGGGGVGFIVVRPAAPVVSGVVSPTATVVP